MWDSQCDTVAQNRIFRYSLSLDSSPVSYLEVINRWQSDTDFLSYFNNLLASCPFKSFRWETPPITNFTAERIFEFVLLNFPHLDRKPDPDAFADHFSEASDDEPVLEFPNLGGDAILVVPCPITDHSNYGHIASFVRNAPEFQKHALWKLVGKVMKQRMNTKPVWLSTAGAGVPWLHIRLDDRPKYYGHVPYQIE